MIHRQALIDTLYLALYQYVEAHDTVPVFDILGALEDIRHSLTEEFISQHPELIHELRCIMSTRH